MNVTSAPPEPHPVLPAVRTVKPDPPPRNTRLLTSTATLALGWCGLMVGALFLRWHPLPEWMLDGGLSVLTAALLFVIVQRWTDTRGAAVAVGLYAVLSVVTLTVLRHAASGLAMRNLNCGGSAQLLVALGCIILLEHLALPPLIWAAILVGASEMHPQFAFVPLLMMTLLRARTLLVIGFVDKARAAALRCAFLCLVLLLIKHALFFSALNSTIKLPMAWWNDSITLPLAWWVASWLCDGEALMPLAARVLLAGILTVATVADFTSWPAMALVLLSAFLTRRRPLAVAQDEPAGNASPLTRGDAAAAPQAS